MRSFRTDMDSVLIKRIMLILRVMQDQEGVLFRDVVKLARDPNHALPVSVKADFQGRGLLQNGVMPDTVRQIILAAISDDGDEISLREATVNLIDKNGGGSRSETIPDRRS